MRSTFAYSKGFISNIGDVILIDSNLITVIRTDTNFTTFVNTHNQAFVVSKSEDINFTRCFRGYKKEYFLLTYPELFL